MKPLKPFAVAFALTVRPPVRLRIGAGDRYTR